MQTISLAMIVKNEELTLERILRCAQTFCDQIVVVDTGSTDRTVEIAKSMGAQVEHFVWVNDFSAARNHSFSFCTSDWILWLDADDVLSEATQQIILGWKDTLLQTTDMDAIFLPYVYGRTRLLRERLIRRSIGYRWVAPVHEVLRVQRGRFIVREDAVVEHATHEDNMPRKAGRNLSILDAWHQSASDARLLYLYGSELMDNRRYAEAVKILEKYVKGCSGFDHDGEQYWATIRLADALKVLKRFEEGIKWCADALRLDPRRGEAYTMMGLLLYDQGQHAAAFGAFAAALSLEPPTVLGAAMPEFYNEVPRRFLVESWKKLGQPAALRRRLELLLPMLLVSEVREVG